MTLDVFTLASDTAEQTALVCTEATNRKGLYETANFTDTLSGRFLIIGKVAGDAVGNDLVDILNVDGTYDSLALVGDSTVKTSIALVEAKVDNITADMPQNVVDAMDSSSLELAAAVTQATTAATQATTAATQATTAATEVGKVPRAADAIPAGGQFAWNAVTDTASKLTLNITEEGA
jgi:hypothetical protein